MEVDAMETKRDINDVFGEWTKERSKTFVISSMDSDDSSQTFDDEIAGPKELMERKVTFVKRKSTDGDDRDSAELKTHDHHTSLNKNNPIDSIETDVSRLAKMSEECLLLKTRQRTLRKQMGLKHKKMAAINQENVTLRNEVTKMAAVMVENDQLKLENERLRLSNLKLEREVRQLEKRISRKEDTISTFKVHIDGQYKRLRADMTRTSEKFETDQESLHTTLKKQQILLTELSKTVQSISKSTGTEDNGNTIKSKGQVKATPSLKNTKSVTGKIIHNKHFK